MKIFQAYPTKKAGNEIIFRFEDDESANKFMATYQLFKQTLIEIQVRSGDMPEYVKQLFKMWFEEFKDVDEFSLRDVEKSVAAELITFMLDFVAEHDVPLKFKPLDALEPDDIKHWEYMSLINGFDVIDGSKPVELAHGEHAVGMGRDRNAISNVGNTVFSLSHAHHMELHRVGLPEFKSKYHINGVLVTPEILRELESRGRRFGTVRE